MPSSAEKMLIDGYSIETGIHLLLNKFLLHSTLKKRNNSGLLNRTSLVLDGEMVQKNGGGVVRQLQVSHAGTQSPFQPLILFNLLRAHVRSAVSWTFKVDLDLIKIQFWPSRDPYLAGRRSGGRGAGETDDSRQICRPALETQ